MRRARAPIRWLALAAVLAVACSPTAETPATSAAPSPGRSGSVASPPARSGSPGAASPAAVACAPAPAAEAHDWNDRVWYELFVRSFADSDGDGVGDLRGLTARLDYLNDGDPSTTDDLGIGGLWLMPVAESPSYHGYDVTDERAIEPDYGTRRDFEAFVAAAHERGIKVIVDLVLNHTSDRHPWFRDARKPGSAHDDWYVWAADNPGYLGPDGQVVWHELGGRWYYGLFSDHMPDLNLRNPRVTAELRDIARFWLRDRGVDGFRLDAAKHLVEDGSAQENTPETLDWLAGFKASVAADKPGSLLVGEVFDPATIAGRYVPDGADLTFNFSLATGVRLALQGGRAAPLATAFGDTIADWPPNQAASFLTNHDQDRIMSQLRGDLPAARLAAFLLLTEPGVPFLYYGEEIGMTGTKPDERIRTPMQWSADAPAAGFSTAEPWEALQDDWQAVNVATQADDPDSLLSTYRDLVRLRAAEDALRVGTTTVVDGGAEPVFAWLRTTPDRALLAVVNVGDAPVTDYGLTLEVGPLCGSRTARLLAAVGGDASTAAAAPAVTASGGLDGYRPLPVLPPRSGFVVALEPAP